MSAVGRRSVTGSSGHGPPAYPEWAVPVGLVVVGVLIVVYYTQFPFDAVDASRSIGDALARFSLTTGSIWDWRAAPANIVMVVPFGLGVGGLATAWGWSRLVGVVVALVAGGSLSVVMEVGQAMWLLREPSLDDIVANALGAAVGAWLWAVVAPGLTAVGRSMGSAARHRRGRSLLYGVSLTPLLAVMVVTVALRQSTELRDWDPDLPLVLGNEATGDRPWSGSLSELAIVDRSLTRTELESWLDGRAMGELVPDSFSWDLDASAGGWSRVPDGWSAEPNAGVPPTVVDGRVGLGPSWWVRTDGPVDELAESVEAAGQFTLAFDAASSTPAQFGTARIVSVSSDVYQRNVTVAQDGTSLVIRVRTPFTGPGGDYPEFALPGVFTDDRPHRIVVTYDPTGVRVVVDDVDDVASLALGPATVPMVTLFPDEVTRLRFSSIGDVARAAFLALFAFGPWCVTMGLLRESTGSRPVTYVLAVAPVVVAELVLAAAVPFVTFRVGHVVAVSAVAVVLTWAVVGWRRRTRAVPTP